MKISSFLPLAAFGLKTILFKKSAPILGPIIVTDRCNLHCKHCSVNNITSVLYPYTQIRREMEQLYSMGIRLLFFCGGETFLWRDGDITLRDLAGSYTHLGAVDNIGLMANGEVQISLNAANTNFMAHDGSLAGMEKQENLRGICTLYPSVIHFLTARDSGIETAADLKGTSGAVGAARCV